ncbi:MAG: hypothetical protein OXU81_10825 [Gammaproteobacteria bacterium]|nr:hypothetical protein [Gammaproteobacteria bacterium]
MTRRIRIASLVATAAIVGVVAPVYAERCVIDLVMLNKERRVEGLVETECGGGPLRFLGIEHTPPFGNWGVRLALHPIVHKHRNGYQFSGWKAMDRWLQWNSCTRRDAEYAPPNYRYYNDSEFTGQKASPDVVNVSHSVNEFDSGPLGTNCEDLHSKNHVTVPATEIRIYELDPFTGGQHVATLPHDAVRIPYECADAWLCYGETDWVISSSGRPAEVSAQFRIVIQLRMKEPTRSSDSRRQ